jgi:hypothetical protein
MSSANEVYQIKVTLLWTDPPIWRRLLVPPDLRLDELASVILISMGWEGMHAHDFKFGKENYSPPSPGGPAYAMAMEMVLGRPGPIDEGRVQLDEVLLRVGSKGVFTYDFGDNWEHSIVFEKRLRADPGMTYPVCTGGERACPPDDIGGVHGFYDKLENSPEEFLEWVGEEWDAEAFSIEEVNQSLKAYV